MSSSGSAPGSGPPPAPGDTKAALRRHCRRQRALALAAEAAGIQAVARRELPALLPPGRHLGLYWPLAGEVDLRDLAATVGPLALPAVAFDPAAPEEGGAPPRLQYRPWAPGDPLAPDHCGIPAPTTVPLLPEALALLLVPALAFDPRCGIRLGYGGGWYDRLRSDPPWRSVPALVVLPAACLLPNLPADPWDVPFPGWLDGAGVHWLHHAQAWGGAMGPPKAL